MDILDGLEVRLGCVALQMVNDVSGAFLDLADFRAGCFLGNVLGDGGDHLHKRLAEVGRQHAHGFVDRHLAIFNLVRHLLNLVGHRCVAGSFRLLGDALQGIACGLLHGLAESGGFGFELLTSLGQAGLLGLQAAFPALLALDVLGVGWVVCILLALRLGCRGGGRFCCGFANGIADSIAISNDHNGIDGLAICSGVTQALGRRFRCDIGCRLVCALDVKAKCFVLGLLDARRIRLVERVLEFGLVALHIVRGGCHGFSFLPASKEAGCPALDCPRLSPRG